MNWKTPAILVAACLLGACSTLHSTFAFQAEAAPQPITPAVLDMPPLPPAPAEAEPGAGIVDRIVPARIDAALKGLVDSGQLVGVSALVYQGDKQVYFGAFGMADREAKKPMTRDTLVQIWSMTKPITGVALMTLYEQGKFKLDDPLSKYLPEFADVKVWDGLDADGQPILVAPKRPITVLDILRHTAGLHEADTKIPALDDLFKKADPLNKNNTLEEMAQKLASLPLLYQPGTRWFYSPGPDLQALLVEKLSGMSFDEYCQKAIFGPLGMTHTFRTVPEDQRAKMAASYTWNGEGDFSRDADEEDYQYNFQPVALERGSAGLVSSLDDYMRFARMLQNEGELDGVRILKPATVRLMATNWLPDAISEREWLPSKGRVGFGLDFAVRTHLPVGPDEAAGEMDEFFWDGAYDTLFWVDPLNQITAVLLTQYHPFGKVPLHPDFRDAVYGPAMPNWTPPTP
jgi:CubicO group peptidase (beta-lactamase class C family)